MGIFDHIDFSNFPKDYKEDSVREEIIAPLLKILGYSAFNPEQCIIRSPHLEHPFIQLGTKKNNVTIIPDYLIQIKGKNAFILEAKAPGENILTGKHVEQAYRYAVHREVQASRFVLCNGEEISVFDTAKPELRLHFRIGNASEENWGELFELVSPAAFSNPHIFDYKNDYGIWCMENGMDENIPQYFYNCYFSDITKMDDNWFSFTAVIQKEVELLASFDFSVSLLPAFMRQVPGPLKNRVQDSLHRYPFQYTVRNAEDSFPLSFQAIVTGEVIKNENEVYIPLQITEFL